jgi:hypothetical protein
MFCVSLQVPVALVQEVLQAKEGPADLQAKYDAFAMRSFVEDNRALVWCTGAAGGHSTAWISLLGIVWYRPAAGGLGIYALRPLRRCSVSRQCRGRCRLLGAIAPAHMTRALDPGFRHACGA